MPSILEAASVRNSVRDVLLANGNIDMSRAVLIAEPSTYAIPVEMDGTTYYAKVQIAVAPWYDTKTAPAFNLDDAVEKMEAKAAEKASRPVREKKPVDPDAEAKKSARASAVADMDADILEYVSGLSDFETSTEIHNAVESVAAETVMFVGARLKKLAEAGLIEMDTHPENKKKRVYRGL